MSDEEESFISLKKKEPDKGTSAEASEQSSDEEAGETSQPHSAQHQTSEGSNDDPDIVAGSREETKGVDETMVNANTIQHVTVPVSLILAGNILVITVIALFDASPQLWLFVMSFASVEVLIGAALWFFHDAT